LSAGRRLVDLIGEVMGFVIDEKDEFESDTDSEEVNREVD